MSPLHAHGLKTTVIYKYIILYIYIYFAYEVQTKQTAFMKSNYATLAPLYTFMADVIVSIYNK